MGYRIPPPGQPISLVDVQSEFGGAIPIGIDEYYGVDDGVPVSGTISLNDFYGTGGEFIWCEGDMSNVVVGVDTELAGHTDVVAMAHHGDNTTILRRTVSSSYVIVSVVNNDGTISTKTSTTVFADANHYFSGLNSTEGYMYNHTTNEVDRYIIDFSTDELLIFDGTPVVVPRPSDNKCMGMSIVYEFSDGVQFVIWTFDSSGNVFDLKAYSIRGGVLTSGTTYNDTGDIYDNYYYARARLDSFFLAYGLSNFRLFYVDPTTNEVSEEASFAAGGNSVIAKTYGQIAGTAHIIVAEKTLEGDAINVYNFRGSNVNPIITIPDTLIAPDFDGICLTGNCFVIAGYEPGNPKKKKIIRSTVYADDMDDFVTLYLQADESPVISLGIQETKTGIQVNGNKWLFYTKDEATNNVRLSALTVNPYIIPDPPSGLPTLWMTDNNEGATEPTLQSFDVSDSENGNIAHLASVLPADLSDDRLGAMVIDSARNIGFFGNAASSSMMYAVDLSVPDDSTNWIIGQVLVNDGYAMDISSLALNIADNLVYAGGSASKEMFTVDVSDPANMTIIGSDNLSSNPRRNMVFDQTKKILYTGTDDKIYAYDTADPSNIIELAEYAHPTLFPFKGDIVLDTERDILIATSIEGLGYLDLSDLTTWEYLPLFDDTECWGIYLTYDQTNKIAIGTTDFNSSGAAVFRFDLSDLVTPELFMYSTNGLPMRPSVDPDKMIAYIPLPDGDTGIEVLDYSTTLVSVVVFPVDMDQVYSALSSS